MRPSSAPRRRKKNQPSEGAAKGGGTRRERPGGEPRAPESPRRLCGRGSLGTRSVAQGGRGPALSWTSPPAELFLGAWRLPTQHPSASSLPEEPTLASSGSLVRTENRTHLMSPGSRAECSCPCRVSFRPCPPVHGSMVDSLSPQRGPERLPDPRLVSPTPSPKPLEGAHTT